MRKIYLISTLVLLSIFYGPASFAQDFSNKGKDFYLCFPQHVPSTTLATLSIWITSDRASSGTITMANGAFSSTFNIAANGLQEIQIAHALAHISNAESFTIIKKSIRIKVDPGKPAVVAYAQQWGAARSAATLLLPVNVLGKKYFSINFTQEGANSGTYIAKSQFQIIAIKNNTVVKITPRQNGTLGTPFIVNFPLAGDMYQYQADLDLSGSLIESVASGGGGCSPIAVFSGSSNITFGRIGCGGGSYDPLFQQGYPVNTWGKNFGFVPFADYPNGSTYRVMASEDNTAVTINGTVVATLNAGQIYPSVFSSNPVMVTSPMSISADKPICVTEYCPSLVCGGGGYGDPDMVILNPIEQNISDITIFSSTQQAITRQWINVLMKTSATASFTINGVVPSSFWIPAPSIPGYSYLRHLLPGSGSYRLKADSGFNAIAYGFSSNFESYAYSAGTNVKDLYQQIGVTTEFGIETTPSVCISSPFKFKVSLPYLADSILWDFSASGLPGPPPNITVKYSSPALPSDADSVRIVNGKNIYWYSLPATYTFNTPGTFPITITTYSPNTEGCGTEQDIDFDLEVSANPVADFNYLPIQCAAEPVSFKDASTTTKPTYKYFWDFGDTASASNTSILKDPFHTFSGPGTYTVKYHNITTPGCLSNEVSHTIVIPPTPTATISASAFACINAAAVPVTFTATGGTAPYTFSYTLDNGSGPVAQTPITTTTGNSVSISVPTTTAGTFIYNLTNVKNQNSTLCSQAVTGQTATITISANTAINLTSASATTSQAVCSNNNITDITYAIGGGGSATVSGLPSGVVFAFNAATGVVTISGAPTVIATTPQTFTYSVNAVGSCLPSSVTGSITINPNAAITLNSAAATDNQEVCKNVAVTNILYGITGGGNGATITGLPAGVNFTFSGGIATISGTPSQAGVFNYTINTTGSCAQTQATGKITVTELPTADFTIVPPGCENKLVTFNDASAPNSGTINSWIWTFGDATTGTGAITTHTYTTAGIYNVGLTVTTDKGCVSNPVASKPVTISVNPKAGFMIPEVCLNDIAADFTDTSKIVSGTITSWKWDFGDPASPTNITNTKDGSHKYLTTGIFPVTHTVFSTTGCSDVITQNIVINGANPIADFTVTNAATLCSNQLVSINDLSSVNPGSVTKVEIYWDNIGAPAAFDLDDVPSNKTYTHQYPVSTTTKNYTIRFRAYSGTLCVNDKIKIITVNATPKVQFLNMPDVCLDAPPFQITQASETGGVAGTATFSGPGVSAAGLFSPAVAGFGTHTINYLFTSTAGGCTDQLSKTIHVLQPVTASFTSSSACENKDVSFSDNTTPTEGILTKWTWDFGDGSPLVIKSSSATFTHKFPAAGPFNVKLVVTTSNGCQSIPKITAITVSPQPKVNFNIPATVCLPDANVTFNNLSSIADGSEGTFTYNWNFGDPLSASNTSTIKNAAHTYTAIGPFNVNLQITSAAGCIHDTTIVLNTIHPQPIADFTTDKIDVCIGGSFNFSDKSNPLDGTITQWDWTMDDGNIKNTPNFTYTYGAVKVYNVGLFIFNSQGCRSNTKTIALGVNPYPTANASPDKLVLEGGQVALTPAMSIGINVNYLWTPATGLNNPTSPSPLASPATDMTYTLVLTSGKGCVSNADNVFVKVLKAPSIPNIFSPNGDGVHDRWDIPYLNTYPGGTIDIYNRYGQLVFHSVGYITSWDGKANGKDVPVGTYYYVIDPKNGRQKYAGYVDVIR